MLHPVTRAKFFKNVAMPFDAGIKSILDEVGQYIKRIRERFDVHDSHRLALMQYDNSALMGGELRLRVADSFGFPSGEEGGTVSFNSDEEIGDARGYTQGRDDSRKEDGRRYESFPL